MNEFPPQVLREYAFLADGERGVIVGPRGEFCWMCAPRWDSDAVFALLVGGHGNYAVTPRERFVWDLTSDPPLATVDILALLFGGLSGTGTRDADVRVALSNAMGLGGHNACVLLGRVD